MTDREKIISLARECGMKVGCDQSPEAALFWYPEVERFYRAAQKEALSNAKVSIPTGTMEQAFQQYHTMGYKKGRKDALELAAKVCEEQRNDPECPERATYCADAIRQLIKEPT